jgi:hypothetical protein
VEPPPLFVGLVTHEGTKFGTSRSHEGLSATTQRRISGAVFREEARDLWEGPELAKAQVLAGHVAERRLERQWLKYLAATDYQRLGLSARHLVRRVRDFLPSEPSSLTRLLNIELAHRSLWTSALDSRAPWALILEDDGWVEDVDDFTEGLEGLINQPRPPAFVNLSASYSPKQLRIDRLLRSAASSWEGRRPRSILESTRPVTNTVCAILYSVEYLKQLVAAWDAEPLFPVVPIDWKMNRILMNFHESSQFPSHGCWFVESGPVIQGSMRPPGRMVR